jgi:hypothetical protein
MENSPETISVARWLKARNKIEADAVSRYLAISRYAKELDLILSDGPGTFLLFQKTDTDSKSVTFESLGDAAQFLVGYQAGRRGSLYGK